jgi:hypothetical protein
VIQRTMLMHYHMPKDHNLRDKEKIQLFLTEIAKSGYSLATFTQPSPTTEKQKPDISANANGNAASLASLPTPLQSDLERFVGNMASSLWILAIPREQKAPLNSFKCGIAFQASSTTLSVVMTLENIAFAIKQNECTLIFEHWLTLFQTAYNIWHPLYAHSLIPASNWPEPSESDLEAGRVPYLYEINFLGPKLVESLEQEQVMSVPAWRAQSLIDGGVLIVPELIFAPRDPHLWENAVQHLQMTQAFWTRYIPAASSF